MLTRRRLFQVSMLDPKHWQREDFVCQTLGEYLPAGEPADKLTVLELEPKDGRYWSYLRPTKHSWGIANIVAVGLGIKSLSDGAVQGMVADAKGVGARLLPSAWEGLATPFGLPSSCADLALISNGAITRLGKASLGRAFAEVRRCLKNNGRFLFVVDEEDERVLGGRLDFGIGDQAVAKFDFEVRGSRRDHGLAVGYFKKVGKTGVLPVSKRVRAKSAIAFGTPAPPGRAAGSAP